jgi:hypothetical protein
MVVTDHVTQSVGGANWLTRTHFVQVASQPPTHSAPSNVKVLSMWSSTKQLYVLILIADRTSPFFVLQHNLHITNTQMACCVCTFILPNYTMDFDVNLPQVARKISFLVHIEYDTDSASQ